MFKKIHVRLTLLGAGVTTLILILMSVLFLRTSGRQLFESAYLSFQNDVAALVTSVEEQSIITNAWMAGMETQKSFYLLLCDNQVLLPLGTKEEQAFRRELYAEISEIFSDQEEALPSTASYSSWHRELTLPDTSLGPCFASFIRFGHSQPRLCAVIVLPTQALEDSLGRQRLIAAVLDLAGALLLLLFFWHFTKRLLAPIEESRRKQTHFVASASHELRTPVAVILSAASACEKAPDGERARILRTIREECLRMKRLLEDMLLLAGADSGALALSSCPTELDTLLLDVCDAFLPLAKEKQLSLDVRLPQQAVPLCTCDPDRIRQVLSILLHNAVSYTPPGGHIRVSVGMSPGREKAALGSRAAVRAGLTPPFIEIRVEDDGPGIPDSEKDSVFLRFYRTDQNRSSKEHFGLGLPIAREIMAAHRGTVSVLDSPMGGALFCLRLPAVPEK